MSQRMSLSCLAVVGACVALAAACASPALAQQYTPHSFASSFDGSDSTGGGWGTRMRDVAVDQQTGNVYVATTEPGIKIHKFDADGVAVPFTDPSLGGSTVLTVGAGFAFGPEIAIDNSGGPHQGRIYVVDGFENLWAFDRSGAEVSGNFPLARGSILAVDPTNGDIWARMGFSGGSVGRFTSDGVGPGATRQFSEYGNPRVLDIGPQGDMYVYTTGAVNGIRKLDLTGKLVYTLPSTLDGFAVDLVDGNVFGVVDEETLEFTAAGAQLPGFVSTENPRNVAVNGVNGNVYVAIRSGGVEIFAPQAPTTLPDAETTAPSDITPSTATLHGSINPDNVATTSCQFEYGTSTAYGTTFPCAEGQIFTGDSDTTVSVPLSGLTLGSIYHYRLTVANANGGFKTADATLTPSAPPEVDNVFVDDVHSDSVVVHAAINPGSAPTTTFHVDYGPSNCLTDPGACTSTPESGSIGRGLDPRPVSTKTTGLAAGTTYHYVVVATNQSGIVKSVDRTFTTFSDVQIADDTCANAHVRQQTGAALLPDCRAYELVSAANAGGANVESYLTADQTPFGGYPLAKSPSRVLYGVHDGAIPGTNHPTNHRLDPYVATRGPQGWSTAYVGIPASLPFSASFASPLLAADAGLDTFAFGGLDLCSPCFVDGSTGVPVRLADGNLVQGMTGPTSPGPAAGPEMLVKEPLSADGSRLVFGSTSEFVDGAGSPAIYARNLLTGTTSDVSRLPNGDPIPCLMNCSSDGLAELDVSADGSRIVIGQLLDVDSAGNRYWHLYMNVGAADRTVDLMPDASTGALFGGMSADGEILYLTSRDQLTGDDTDSSADIFRADVDASSAALSLVSAGAGAGNSDACTPVGNLANTHWNVPGGAPADCSALAIGGGGGVASGSGAIYFLTPELLDGTANGTAGAPNLYLARPGAEPHFIATLESELTGPTPPLRYHPYDHSFEGGADPQFIAVDSSDGAVYVADKSADVVRKYDASGNPVTTWADNGVLDGAITGKGLFGPIAGIAVGSGGTLYVGILTGNTLAHDMFEFNQDGTPASSAAVTGVIGPAGVAVDADGNVYYVDERDLFGGGTESQIYRYRSGTSTPISTNVFGSGHKTGLAIDPNSGDLYAIFGGGKVARFDFDSSGNVKDLDGSSCSSECDPTTHFGTGTIFGAKGLAVDPSNGVIQVDEGGRILRFDSNGQRVPGPDTGTGVLSNSSRVAVAGDGTLYANNTTPGGREVAVFAPLEPAPDPQIDNPAIVHSVNDAGTRHTADFQVTPSGEDAVFSTTIPFSGYDNAGHAQAFRYDAASDELACASCNPTNARATGDAELAASGLSLTDDGFLFFTTTEPLAPRDLDNRKDVYKWQPDEGASLISTGVSEFDSILLSASADGADAYFFTRDSLVPQDQNGRLVKIYDARAGGGFPHAPPPAPCKASDECHGAGTRQPVAPNINSVAGTTGNLVRPNRGRKRCKRGFVRRGNRKGNRSRKSNRKRCVRRHKKRHHKRGKGKRRNERQGGKR